MLNILNHLGVALFKNVLGRSSINRSYNYSVDAGLCHDYPRSQLANQLYGWIVPGLSLILLKLLNILPDYFLIKNISHLQMLVGLFTEVEGNKT